MEIQAVFNANTDEDWFAAQLLAGVSYQLVLSPEQNSGVFHLNATSETDGEFLLRDTDIRRTELANNQGADDTYLVFTPLINALFYIQASHSDVINNAGIPEDIPTTSEELDILALLDPEALQLILVQFGFDNPDDFKTFLGNSNNSPSEWPNNYSLSINAINDDYADNVETTGIITDGATVPGNIDAIGDSDWFKADLSAGVTYQFSLQSASLESLNLNAYSLGKDRIESPDYNPFDVTNLVFTPNEDSTFFIEIDGKFSKATGNYSLSLSSIIDDYADTNATTGSVAVGGTTNGTLNAIDDADVFKTVLAPNTTYQITASASKGSLGLFLGISSTHDNGLSLDSGERLDYGTLDTTQASSSTSIITFSTLEGGSYFIRLEDIGTSVRNDFNSEIFLPLDYNISVSTVSDDYYDTTNTSGSVSVGNLANGKLEVINDNDWFKASLESGITYQAKIIAADPEHQFNLQVLSDNSLDPILDSVTRFETALSLDNQQIVFTPRQNGEFYFDVSSWTGSTGNYSLELTTIDDDFADTIDTTGVVLVGQSLSGEINAVGDKDWIAVDLDRDITYQINLSNDSSSLVETLGLTVYSREDSEYSSVAEQNKWRGEFSSVSQITFTPNNSGRFYVEVQNHSLELTDYTVSVTTIEDDYPDHDGTIGVLLTGQLSDNSPTITDPNSDGIYWDSAIQKDGITIIAEDAQLYRAYMGALGRLPDEEGFNWWANEIAQSRHSLSSMAAGFIYSVEFQGLADTDSNGTVNSEEFITHMYQGVFDREPDEEGFSFWVGKLDREESTQSQVLVDMTQSNEYIENTIQTVWDFQFI